MMESTQAFLLTAQDPYSDFNIEHGIFDRCAATKRYVASNALRMVVFL
jgi:hypothetical protein